MSGERKAKRPSRERARPKAGEGTAQEGAAGQSKSGGLRDTIAFLVAVAILVPVLVFTALSFYRSDGPDERSAAPTTAGPATGPRAAIVDQLSLTQPNPGFVERATEILEQAGYAVDYYAGGRVTVDFYRDLPARSHEYMILRVHSTAELLSAGGPTVRESLALFTSEPYSPDKYVDEQAARRLGIVSYYEGGQEYFGIEPEFVRSSIKGKFQETVIILMGCDGLRSDEAAEAFVQKGAKAFISWSGRVSASHTDAATERLLQHLVIDRLTIEEAVAQTMAEVGPDPTYGTSLLFYPPEGVASGPGEAYLAR